MLRRKKPWRGRRGGRNICDIPIDFFDFIKRAALEEKRKVSPEVVTRYQQRHERRIDPRFAKIFYENGFQSLGGILRPANLIHERPAALFEDLGAVLDIEVEKFLRRTGLSIFRRRAQAERDDSSSGSPGDEMEGLMSGAADPLKVLPLDDLRISPANAAPVNREDFNALSTRFRHRGLLCIDWSLQGQAVEG